ncbi:hypothetical protein, partial [Nocardioides luteus]
MHWQRLAPAGLLLAAFGLFALSVFQPPAPGGGVRFNLGVVVLLVGAAGAWWWRGRAGVVLGLAAVVVVTFVSVRNGLGPELIADSGVPEAVARWIEVVGLLVAAVGLVRRWFRPLPPRSDPSGQEGPERTPRRPRVTRFQVIGLLVLSALGAELLAAYADNTGDPGAIAFAVVFFGALYGAPALLARELVRRRGWGWPSLLLLFAALGTAQAGLIDQSLFSADYGGYEGWEESREPTLIPALGFSGYNAYSFIIGHVIYSFAAPLALAEAWVPSTARRPWVGAIGAVLAVVGYGVAAALIVNDPESRSGSPAQLVGAAVVVAGFVLAAVLVGVRRARHPRAESASSDSRPLPIWQIVAVGLVAAVIPDLLPATWLGVFVAVTTTSAIAVLVWLASRTRPWTLRHTAALAATYLLLRGILAFTYFPLIGDVAPFPKYAHNAVMLLAITLATWASLRPNPPR